MLISIFTYWTTASGGCEYFPDFDETDPGSKISITAALITYTQVPASGVYRVSKSYGVDHFDVGLVHDIQWKVTDASHQFDPAMAVAWGITNTESEYWDWTQNNREALSLHFTDTRFNYAAYLEDSATGEYDLANLDEGTQYYGTVSWFSSTELELEIFSDPEELILEDTLSITLTPGTAYEFLVPYCNANAGDSVNMSGTVGCLDIHEA